MQVYLDSSVILRILLGQPGALKQWDGWDACCTSEIASVEILRALDKLRLQNKLSDVEIAEKIRALWEFFTALQTISLSQAVLRRAAQSFPTIVGTLDAIHLASAVLFQEHKKSEIVFLTHDKQLGIAAKALGLESQGF